MMNKIENLIVILLSIKILIQHKRKISTLENIDSNVNYDFLGGVFYWSDEIKENYPPDLNSILKYSLVHRQSLIVNKQISDSQSKLIYQITKLICPNWIGFKVERNTFSTELSERFQRIEKVEEWKIDKLN